jgi:hypothetical protein
MLRRGDQSKGESLSRQGVELTDVVSDALKVSTSWD